MSREASGGWRRGLSFSDETAVLTWLRLGRAGAPPGLPPAVARALTGTDDAREAVAAVLLRDLLWSPAWVTRSLEWLEAEKRRLPAALRATLGTDGHLDSAGPSARAGWPCLSGRHARLEWLDRHPAADAAPGARPELASLALWPVAERTEVVERATQRALALLLQVLGPRQRLAVLTALGEAVDLEVRGGEPPGRQVAEGESLQLETAPAFRAGFARAATSAAGPAHLLERFGTFVIAHALGPGFHVEARALAQASSVRAGRRLLRYHHRARSAASAVVADARRLVEAAMADVAARARAAAPGSERP
jgi:hypothetical protein